MRMVQINMSIPESCASCPLSVRLFGKLYCPPLDGRVGNEGKDSRCPLVDADDQFAEVSKKDVIYRQDAIDAVVRVREYHAYDEIEELKALPSVQPERTCVNCGRTVNNGGWYADGRTRCPIEEHYALPKDGYCHLWEKRNVTDDDYPERRTDGRD
jgi:hypothetical protein